MPASEWLRKINRMLYTYVEPLAPSQRSLYAVVIKQEEPLIIDELAIGK